MAKCADEEDGYKNEPKPQSQHLKDILRCTLYVESHKKLEGARGRLVKKYGNWGVKDRRSEEPRDVLQVVKFKGLLVEVQFHFRAVVAAKKISHAAYNVVRCNTNNWPGSMSTLFDVVGILALKDNGDSGTIPVSEEDLRSKFCKLVV